MNIFEKHPRPWAYKHGRIQSATGKTAIELHRDDARLEWDSLVECVNALNGIENPVQWVGDMKNKVEALEILQNARAVAYQEQSIELNDAKQRIAELESTVDLWKSKYVNARDGASELEQQLAKQPENISDAVYYFANWKISAQDAQEWLSQTHPTAPEEQ